MKMGVSVMLLLSNWRGHSTRARCIPSRWWEKHPTCWHCWILWEPARISRWLSVSATLNNMGEVYRATGRPQQALTLYEQALPISREVGDCRGEGTALGNLGNVYADLGEMDRAVGYYEQAMAIDQDIGNREGVARHSWNLGLLYEQQGDLARAVALMQVAVDFYTQIGHAQYTEVMSEGLARVHRRANSDTQPCRGTIV
jgi:tetratricopeptide (TPR) repeat protein